MACSCHLSPLRLFVRGMSQLHVSGHVATRLSRPISSNLGTSQAGRRSPFTTTSSAQREKSKADPNTYLKYEKSAGPHKENRRKHRAAAKESPDGDGSPTAASEKPNWKIQKAALKEKFPEGWKPQKRLSPDAIAGIRALHAQFPDTYTTNRLASTFEVSPEAIRRILKSRWQPSPEEEENRQERWFRRGVSVWTRFAELGVKPPQRWRREGVARDPAYHEKRKTAIERRKKEEVDEDKGERLQQKLGRSIM